MTPHARRRWLTDLLFIGGALAVAAGLAAGVHSAERPLQTPVPEATQCTKPAASDTPIVVTCTPQAVAPIQRDFVAPGMVAPPPQPGPRPRRAAATPSISVSMPGESISSGVSPARVGSAGRKP